MARWFLSRVVGWLVVLVVATVACAPAMRRAETIAPLTITFASPEWTGRAIPEGAQCRAQGGTKGSPALAVEGIPPGTTHLLVLFNDRSYPPLSSGGGHGTLRLDVPPGVSRLTVPSVPSETMTLPSGILVEAPHRGDVPGLRAGGYLAPCSGGRGNVYEAQVLAVSRTGQKDTPATILGEGTIVIGRY
jgi:hypothetical protein